VEVPDRTGGTSRLAEPPGLVRHRRRPEAGRKLAARGRGGLGPLPDAEGVPEGVTVRAGILAIAAAEAVSPHDYEVGGRFGRGDRAEYRL